jgi:hypothetical protein
MEPTLVLKVSVTATPVLTTEPSLLHVSVMYRDDEVTGAGRAVGSPLVNADSNGEVVDGPSSTVK